MSDWYVGQKVVCVNAQPISGVRNRFVDKHLREGRIYKIREILLFGFLSDNKRDERLAFRLEGIVPEPIEGTEYAFFHGRFRPMEAGDVHEDVDISVFLEDLEKINNGLITFREEETRELEPIE
jgi:hypothetical protein